MVKTERAGTLTGIGARVRLRRRELDLTQESLASKAGVSKSFVSEVEGGQTAAGGLVYLQIADALDVTVEWLLTGALAEIPSLNIPNTSFGRRVGARVWVVVPGHDGDRSGNAGGGGTPQSRRPALGADARVRARHRGGSEGCSG
jgi:DNA-binding XRE family transcriptional regulator